MSNWLGKNSVGVPIPGSAEIIRRPRCPKCNSIRNRVVRSVEIESPEDPRIQYRKCADCGNNFKTILE